MKDITYVTLGITIKNGTIAICTKCGAKAAETQPNLVWLCPPCGKDPVYCICKD